jgi:hypothetical protein
MGHKLFSSSALRMDVAIKCSHVCVLGGNIYMFNERQDTMIPMGHRVNKSQKGIHMAKVEFFVGRYRRISYKIIKTSYDNLIVE